MADGDLLESALLSPLTFGAAEVQVLDATTGADGLVVRVIGIEADALGVRAVVAAFEASDALSRHATEMIDHALGRIAAPLLPALLVAGGVTYAWFSTLPPEEQAALTEQLGDDLGRLLHEHPGLAQHVVNSGGGLIGSLVPGVGLLDRGDGPIHRATTNDAARLMALLLGNDTDHSVSRRDDLDGHGATPHAPGSLEALLHQLSATNGLGLADGADHGAIQIQRIGVAPHERYIVYLPGTDDMSPLPVSDDRARDMETNYQLIGGLDTAYGHGIRQAMTEAGLTRKDVMLVGHSQGGMVSTSLAADPDFQRQFNVQHVVTAGSPTAQVPLLPDGTHAIHLENRGDAVPLLDGEDNPDQPHRTTVRFDAGGTDVADTHGLDHYTRGAAAADASANGSIRDQLDRMREDGFLGDGPSGPVRTWVVTRPVG